jgi:carboxyl-terminal processing protease
VPRSRIGTARQWIAILALGVSVNGTRAAPAPADHWRQEAQEFERLGQWEKACESYARLLAQDRQQPEVRDRLRQCIRRLHQARRHRDPIYLSRVLTLPMSQALALYVEVLTKLHGQYADADKVPFDRLYQNGLDELRFALSDATFVREHLAGVEPNALADLCDRLRDEPAVRGLNTAKDARAALRDLAWKVQRSTGLNPTITVLEFACGASNALDEYTFFLTPGQPLDDPTVLSGELAAYGLLLNWKDGQLVVERVVAGSWTAGTGVQSGDRVTHIGKQPLDRLSPANVVQVLRGDAVAVTDLTLTSVDGMTTHTLTLPGFVPSVVDDRIERDGVGYLRLANFQKTTLQELDSALVRLRSEGMRVLVLDLRGNPGGLFTAAVQVAERFIPAGVIVSTQGQVRTFSKMYLAQNAMAATDVPLVVLVDADTASAAEVVAGALKENDRAVLVGQPTYGKASIQKLLTLQAGAGLYLTLARFYSPRGQPFAGVGVAPHVVEPRRDPMKDSQLDLAVEQAVRLLGMR